MLNMSVPVPSAVKILVADDDADFGRILKRFLEADGHTCDLVPDGARALEAMAATTYDVLIADIDMPGNRGLELVQTLVDAKERPPVILMTGNPTIATATKSVGLAVFACVTKPFDAAELRRLVRDATASGRIRRAVRASEQRIEVWAQDIARIRELIQHAPDAATGVQSYLAVTLGNLVAAVSDFAEVAEVMSQSSAHKKRLETATLVTALQETISVLENTRQVFKSKELGALRKKLESLVR